MNRWVLDPQVFYTKLTDYMTHVGLPWDARDEAVWQAQMAEEIKRLGAIMGEGAGRSVLDCSCGWGGQAIPLAKLGWHVTAADISEANLNTAQERARQAGSQIDFVVRDMRDLGFQATFDWVVSCMALYDIVADADIHSAVQGMFAALKPGGKCYIRLRDHDHLMDEKPRHEFHGEQHTPHGRVICIEDWDYESETHITHSYAFLKEDERYQNYRRWTTETLGCRIRVMRKAELAQFLSAAGFGQVEFLPQPSGWHPYEVVASKADR